MQGLQQVFIGFDAREAAAFAVAQTTIARRTLQRVPVYGLVLDDLRKAGLYARPTSRRERPEGGGVLWDDISGAPMSTEFAISRFLTPHLAGEGLALFMDCDMLVRGNLGELFAICEADKSKAVWCVKHNFAPPEGVKMDGQLQTLYARKNWSSVMVFNVDHPSNRKLTVELVNTVPGRDLHRFCWLEDHEIGELGAEWNYLVGHTSLADGVEPKIVHHTDGVPFMPGYEDAEFADEWRAALHCWAGSDALGLRLRRRAA